MTLSVLEAGRKRRIGERYSRVVQKEGIAEGVERRRVALRELELAGGHRTHVDAPIGSMAAR